LVTLNDEGALDLGKIAKKVKQLLVPKGRADKQFGLQILRMMQRGVVDVLVDVRAHVRERRVQAEGLPPNCCVIVAAGAVFARACCVVGHRPQRVRACVWTLLPRYVGPKAHSERKRSAESCTA
jgi:hypothetical protein